MLVETNRVLTSLSSLSSLSTQLSASTQGQSTGGQAPLNALSADHLALSDQAGGGDQACGGEQTMAFSDHPASFDKSCCCDADDMAGDEDRAEKYIIDIPFSVLWSIVQSLDADKGWEALAAETGYTFDKIRLLELEGTRMQGSPTKSLLWDLGSRNTTVRRLYGYLSAIRRFREMKILEDYVNSSAPSASSFEAHGLIGLKSSRSSDDGGSDSLKGLKPPNVSVPSEKKGSPSASMQSESINFNQPATGAYNNSLKVGDKQDMYTGKQIPNVATDSKGAASQGASPKGSRQNVNIDPSKIQVPKMKPCMPGVRDISRQLPGDRSSSGSNSSTSSSCSNQKAPPTGRPPSNNHVPSPTPSPYSDLPSNSSLTSLDSLPSWLDEETRVAAMGSACFMYSEICQATDNFSEANKIGEGAFGTVYFGILRHQKCAVKKMAEVNNQETCVERSTQIKREITSLLKFRHENIVTLYGYALDGPSVCLVYQYMPNGSLEDRLLCKKGSSPLLWSQRLNILVGACQGLNFLHTIGQQPLIHGDIKSANILLDKHLEARIGDLGQAQQATGREGGSNSSRYTHITRAQATTKLYGTRAYQPTEVQTGGRPSTKSDVFAMGVVLLEVFSGQQAYDDRREGDRGLADYFRNNVTSDELEKWLPQIDKRAGECPHDVAMEMLRLAYTATSGLKKQRPDSTKLLQEMMKIDQMYKDLAGEEAPQSIVGSEHSCHMSHTSAPGNGRRDNLTGAPRTEQAATAVETGSQHHPGSHLAVSVGQLGVAVPASRQSSMASNESITPSPIDYFPEGQPLPPAFRIQQEYDRRQNMQAQGKQIQRLSECYPTREVARQDGSLPKSDPKKLQELEQFDQLNLGEGSAQSNLDPAHFRSDPKKLEALKQFDGDQQTPASAAGQVEESAGGNGDGQLACDPKKMEYLRQFDDNNMAGGKPNAQDGSCMPQSETLAEGQYASDPRKLRYLTQFDDAQYQPGVSGNAGEAFPVSQVDYVLTSQREALRACNESLHHSLNHTPCSDRSTEGSGAVEQYDTSITKVMTASSVSCVKDTADANSGHDLSTKVTAIDNVNQVKDTSASSHTGHDLRTKVTAVDNVNQVSDVPDPASGRDFGLSDAAPSKETMLARRSNFIEQYMQALENMSDDEDFDYNSGDVGGDGYGNSGEGACNGILDEEQCTGNESTPLSINKDIAANLDKPGQKYIPDPVASLRNQSASVVNGYHPDNRNRSVAVSVDHHPAPTEQDEESNLDLNYFRERAHYYSKAFTKT